MMVAAYAVYMEDEDPSEFELTLTSYPPENKIKVIKLIRDELGLLLRDAVELVEDLPQILVEGGCKERVEELRGLFEALGCQVSVVGV
jgi:large subunit ribosomal protein L7/L12